MLTEEGSEATPGAKQAIADFAILYARKLVRKSLFPNKNTVSAEDVRNAYEVMNKHHSADL